MAVPIKKLEPSLVGKNISLGGVISKIKKIYLKNQKAMMFVTLEDMDSNTEILVFPKTLEETGSVWEEEKIILASGRLSDKDGTLKLLCDSAKVVNEQELEHFKRVLSTQKANGDLKPKVIITLPGDFDKEILKSLSGFFDRCEAGAMKVYLSIGPSRLETPYCIKKSDTLEEEIKKILPEGRIEIKN
jgi:DNA polymerase-3 subunit alpha